MLRICVDMDEVMADTLAEHLRRYNQTFDEDVTPQDLAGKGLWEVTPLDRQQQLRAFLDAEDFFEDLALMPGAQDVLKSLSARYEIFIATQAMTVPNSLGPKYRWLQRHFPFIPRTTSSAATSPSSAPTTSSTTCPRTSSASRARASSIPPRTTWPPPASSASRTGKRSPSISPRSKTDSRGWTCIQQNLTVYL
jgi:hypothetical protein